MFAKKFLACFGGSKLQTKINYLTNLSHEPFMLELFSKHFANVVPDAVVPQENGFL